MSRIHLGPVPGDIMVDITAQNVIPAPKV